MSHSSSRRRSLKRDIHEPGRKVKNFDKSNNSLVVLGQRKPTPKDVTEKCLKGILNSKVQPKSFKQGQRRKSTEAVFVVSKPKSLKISQKSNSYVRNKCKRERNLTQLEKIYKDMLR